MTPTRTNWVALNQFTVIEAGRNRRPDIVLFVNGLPFAVIELKDATDEQATVWSAHNQLQTYKAEIPSLFDFNEILVISDGIEARVGSLTANREWFLPWRTIEGEDAASNLQPELETVLKGVVRSPTAAALPAALHHLRGRTGASSGKSSPGTTNSTRSTARSRRRSRRLRSRATAGRGSSGTPRGRARA